MLENCQKNPTILQFLEGPMFLNPLILLEEESPEDYSLIDPKISLLSQKNSLIARKNSLVVLREFLRDEAVTPYSGGACPGS